MFHLFLLKNKEKKNRDAHIGFIKNTKLWLKFSVNQTIYKNIC